MPPLCLGLGTCSLSFPLSPGLCSVGAGTGGTEGIGSRLTPRAHCALLMWGCITEAASHAPLPTLALPVADVWPLSC